MIEVPKDIQTVYGNFFLKNESGQYFVSELDRLINDCHRQAENNPELSRDFVQRAKGLREVENHINSVIGGKA